MGVLVLALAIMDNNKNSHLEVMKAEVPGPVFGKIVSKLKNTAQILYYLYLASSSSLSLSISVLTCPCMIVLSLPWGQPELVVLLSLTMELPTTIRLSSPICQFRSLGLWG